MEIRASESDSFEAHRRMLEQIVALPATLFFPTKIVAQLHEICRMLGYTPAELVVKALKDQLNCWDKFYRDVNAPPEKPEDFTWPDDPLSCLASAATIHFINSFRRCIHNAVAFAQLKENAPAEWSFRSFEERDEHNDKDQVQ